MNKYVKVLLIITGIFFCLLIVARLSGAISFFTIPTPSNEPNIKENSYLFASRFKSPHQGDFVLYKNPYTDSLNNSFGISSASGQYYVHRFCATENDIIQMKNAVLFVNGKNADEKFNLYHYYTIAPEDKPAIELIYDKKREENLLFIDSALVVNLTTEMIRKTDPKIKISLWRSPDPSSQNGPFKWYDHNEKNWTIDDFGPLEIPKGYCFVLGDNRNNSLDSRYVGFIKLSNIKGVKL
jgi:signal peptidase I